MVKVFIFLFFLTINAYSQDSSGITEDSNELKNTIIIPHLNYPITQGKNIMYCASFQLAWNEMQDSIIKERIILNNKKANAIATELNKKNFIKNDILPECTYTKAGVLTLELVNEINKSIKNKFKGNAPAGITAIIPNTPAFFCYAFLYKSILFKTPFQKTKPIIFHSEMTGFSENRSFGCDEHTILSEPESTRSQVEIFNYKNPADFIVRLSGKDDTDQIVLARTKPLATLSATLNAIESRINKNKPERLNTFDTLRIPCIETDIKTSFDDLNNADFLNSHWRNWYIEKTYQSIKFKLNQEGSELKSVATIEAFFSSPWHSEPGHKRMIFDGPFLLYLKETRASKAYFVVWVNNAELFENK